MDRWAGYEIQTLDFELTDVVAGLEARNLRDGSDAAVISRPVGGSCGEAFDHHDKKRPETF